MKRIRKSNIDYSAMRELGLSTLAIACYAALDGERGGHAVDVAERLGRQAKNVYPVLDKLKKLGLVWTFKIEGYDSMWFRAVSLEKAFDGYMDHRRLLLRPIMQAQRGREPLV